jgi:hypothetical protein
MVISHNKEEPMNPFTNPAIINEDAIEALTPEQIEQALDILTNAGY